MIKNFVVLGLRNMLKNKLISFFTILGLSLSIGFSIVAFIFIEFTYNQDTFHNDRDRVFMLTHTREANALAKGYVPSILGKTLKNDLPQVEQVVRMDNARVVVQVEDKEPFYETITYSDPAFFEVFTFPLKWGSTTALEEPSAIIISEAFALKYFGDANPLGKVVKLKLSNDVDVSVQIGGVAEAFPLRSSFNFDILINFHALQAVNTNYESWGYNATATFVKTRKAEDSTVLASQLDTYVAEFNGMFPHTPIVKYGIEPLLTLSKNSYNISGDIARTFGPPAGKLGFGILALLLLSIASLNYINTFIAMGTTRLKEIGLRKTIGSSRAKIIAQFMIENLVLCFFALIAGIILAELVFLKGFESIMQIGLTFEIDNPSLWIFLICLLIGIALISGAYPSFYISKFQAGTILRGGKIMGSKSSFSKVFLSLQYVLSFIYIVMGLMFVANENYHKNKDWGYNQENMLVVHPKDQQAFNYLKHEMEKHPDVVSITGSREHVGFENRQIKIKADDTHHNVYSFDVDNNYFSTLGLRVLKGTSFEQLPEAEHRNVIINETFARNLGWAEPIGKSFVHNDATWIVSGVVQDFLFESSSILKQIEPAVFKQASPDVYQTLVVRVREGASGNVLEQLKESWAIASPGIPFTGFYQDETLHTFFEFMEGTNRIMYSAAIMAILLSAFGVFGLMYLNIVSRIKDYSVMKVLGATPSDLVKKVVKVYTWYLLAALVLGVPASIYITKFMFSLVYTEYAPFSVLYPLIATFILLAITACTAAFLVGKLLKKNPAIALRAE